MASIKAILRGRFFNRPNSIEGGDGIIFTDASDRAYVISHNLVAGLGLVFTTVLGAVTIGKGGRLSKAMAGTGTTALIASEAAKSIIEFTGAITGNVVATIPALTDGAEWTLFNNTTGAHTLTFKGLTGNGIAITQGKRVRCYCDGTDIFASGAEA